MVKRIIFFFFLFVILFWRNSQANTNIVEVANWKDAHQGALSISVDDTCTSCFTALTKNGFRGSYFVLNAKSRRQCLFDYPKLFIFHLLGHEIGSHTVNHPHGQVLADYMRNEFVNNIYEIETKMGIPGKDIVSMAWPAGFVQHKNIAAEYFLCARGYNINKLEDVTPTDFMNLKSYNSHEHKPFPPLDLKVVLNEAEKQGKWAILVFHSACNDDGTIAYVKTKDLWVAPIGTVIKYIWQRNTIQITNIQERPSQIKFTVTKSIISASRVRSFENAFNPSDEVTLKIDIDDAHKISRVKVNGRNTRYKIKTINNNKYLLLNTYIPTGTMKSVEINYCGIIK